MRIFIFLFFVINLCFSFDLKSINNIKADFIQITTSDNNKIEYSGNAVITKGYKSYYEYTKPIKKQVFINEKEIIVYEPHLSQAIIFDSKRKGLVDVLNNAKIEGDRIISHIDDMTFFVSLDSNDMPQKIEYIDNLDNKIEIILKNVKINTDINENIFIFNAPQKTDIIHSNANFFQQ